MTPRSMSHWDDGGIRGPEACRIAGITYRSLDYWDNTGLVRPSIARAAGSGSSRRYSPRDVLLLAVVKQLTELGVTLRGVRQQIAGFDEIPNDHDTWERLLLVWTPRSMTVVTADALIAAVLDRVADHPVAVIALAPIAHRIRTSAAAVVSSPTIPSGAAHAHVPGDETTGTARVLLEQTAARTGLGGSTREADPVLGPASRLLDRERDTAHVHEHVGGIQISA